jgi:hypothetical protein
LPTVEQDGQRFGLPVTRSTYPVGQAGVRLSLEQMARLIIQGSQSLVLQTMAEGIVRNWASVPANVQVTNAQAAQIFLDYVRATVRYRPDPPASEYMKSAAVTLCAPGTNLCVQVGDCDDLSIALASLCAAYGIPVRILKQIFGSDAQEHVLVAIQTDSGDWLPADPSVPDKPVGWKASASHEDYIDPHDPATIATIVGREAEFIGVGRVGIWRGSVPTARSLVQLVGAGLGAPPKTFGQPPSYALVADKKVFHGNRYRVGMLVSFVNVAPNYVPDPLSLNFTDEQMVRGALASDWTIEQLTPTGDVVGGVQSWVLQGVSKSDQTLTDSPFITYSVVAGEVLSTPGVIPPPPSTASGNVGPMKAAAIFGGLGLLSYFVAPRIFKKRRRR